MSLGFGDPLTGNESQHDVTEWIADALREALGSSDGDWRDRVEVNHSFQSYATIRLANGAEFQVTPVRSAWPDDGTSTQFAYIEEEEPTHG